MISTTMLLTRIMCLNEKMVHHSDLLGKDTRHIVKRLKYRSHYLRETSKRN